MTRAGEKGNAQTEYMIVMVLVTLLVVVVLALFLRNQSGAQVSQLARDLVTLDGRIQLFQANSTSPIENSILSQAGVFRDLQSLEDKNGKVNVKFGGRTPGSDHSFVVYSDPNFGVMYFMSSLDLSYCMPLLTQFAKTASFIAVNNQIVKAPGGANTPLKAKCDPANGADMFSLQVSF